MSLSDPIADMLTVIRNANALSKEVVEVPASNLKQEILYIMKEEGYIRNFKAVDQETRKFLRIYLREEGSKKNLITGIRRVSKPGLRRYAGSRKLPRVMGGLGIAILTTSQGIMSDRQAKQSRLGGEMIGYVW